MQFLRVNFLIFLLIFLFFVSFVRNENLANDEVSDIVSNTFIGFEKVESIPVSFPKDMCLLNVERVKYAAALHKAENGEQHFVAFRVSQDQVYDTIFDIPAPLAIAMDCASLGNKAYIALGYNLTGPIKEATDGSPIFEIYRGRVRAIQYFALPNLKSVHLRAHGADLFLMQSFQATDTKSHFNCPYYRWSGYGFQLLGDIPCNNAKHLELFSIDGEMFIAVANYLGRHGTLEANSEIYKFSNSQKRFSLFQKIRTFGAVDVKHFAVEGGELPVQHCLIFANSKSAHEGLQATSIVYKYERGLFEPYDKLVLYAVQEFLPLGVDVGKFILLAACDDQPTKIFQLNGWQFEESSVQLTDGALGEGVSKLRTFQTDDRTYLVVANEKMLQNATNVFLPVFRPESGARELRQRIIEWCERTLTRFSAEDLDKLKSDLQARKKGTSVLENARIVSAVTSNLNYSKMNMSTNYWNTLRKAHKTVERLQDQLKEKMKRIRSTQKQEAESVDLDTLVVKKILKAKTVNNETGDSLHLSKISANEVIGDIRGSDNTMRTFSENTPETKYDVVRVDKLNLTGLLNGIKFETIRENALRKTGNQVIEGPMNVNYLKAKSISTTDGLLNGLNVSRLILIDGGNFVVNQDIQFAEPIYAKKLIVNERINNIHVTNGKLDVLLTKSKQPQSVTGVKTMENVTILEPVTIGGKILGPHLERMLPVKPVHENLHLTGDFTITGNVIIGKSLSGSNIFGKSSDISLQNLLDNGLEKTDPVHGIRIQFEKPVTVEDVALKSANGFDLTDLVKVNTGEVQVVRAHKTFTGDLSIHRGFFHAEELNGVNIDEFGKSILTKFDDQVISGNWKFRKITVDSVNASAITFNNVDMSNFLTTSSDQTITGKVRTRKLKAKSANIANLLTSSKIFNTSLDDILHPHSSADYLKVFGGDSKISGNVHVRNLKVGKSVNGKDIEAIEKDLLQLDANVKFVGPITFEHEIRVNNLTFFGSFNDIPAVDFGRNWLLNGTDQIFTAPQTFTTVTFTKDLSLAGALNERDFDYLVRNLYRTDKDEHIESIHFENDIISHAPIATNGLINDLNFETDMLLTENSGTQTIHGWVTGQKSLKVHGNISNVAKVNSIDLTELENFLSDDLDSITVRNAIFENSPEFETINGYNLTELIDSVWLKHSDVNLPYHVQILDASFEGETEIRGPINERNLDYLSNTYFSLTKPQDVYQDMKFTSTVTFENDFVGEELHVYDRITDAVSGLQIDNFEHFIKNTLTKDTDQEIKEEWTIHKISVDGDLNDVLINGLNFHDVLLYNNTEIPRITALKTVSSANIQRLFCMPQSTVNDVNMSDWIRKAVFVYDNFTIQGSTTIDSLLSYGDVRVLETVNNLTFDKNSLLISGEPQTIRGSVRLVTKYPNDQKIISSVFQSLHARTLNHNINLDEFLDGLVEAASEIEVAGRVVFETPLVTKDFNANRYVYDMNLAEFFADFNSSSYALGKALQSLKSTAQAVESYYKNNTTRFDFRQDIAGRGDGRKLQENFVELDGE